MSIDNTLSLTIRRHVLSFVIASFQSLDSGLIRKECAPLVSISIWHNLSSDVMRESKFERYSQLRKAWRVAGKRWDAADDVTKARIRFERSWLYSMMLDFINRMYESGGNAQGTKAEEAFWMRANISRELVILRTIH
jgi:intron-binding protein aquarius